MTNDEAAIHGLIERWSKAVRDEDLSAVQEFHDPDILMFDVPPPLQVRGLEAYLATWKTFLAWSTRPITFYFDDVNVTAGSDVAWATAIGRCKGNESDGKTVHLEFRLTMGLRKRQGAWIIVHEHHSIPAAE